MNLTEFRKDISKHFNDAVQGRPVFITRAGQMFKLEAYIPPVGGTAITYKLTPKENIKKKVPAPKLPDIPGIITADKLPSNIKLCKIHDIPLDSRGKCLQKGCKYA